MKMVMIFTRFRSKTWAPTEGKQKLVGVQSQGNNTVTIKDGKLFVTGPDHDVSTAIAIQLASGQAKLGNVGEKQVLVIFGQDEAELGQVAVGDQSSQVKDQVGHGQGQELHNIMSNKFIIQG